MEEGSIDVESIDELAELRLKLTEVKRHFNLARDELYNLTRSYYNQSIASDYISEESLETLINRCKSVKTEYFQIQEQLKEKLPKAKNMSFRESFNFNN